MNILEKEIEELVGEVLENGIHRGLNEGEHKIIRQFNLPGYGVIDLVAIPINYEEDVTIDIYELKRDKIDVNALMQLCRYLKGFKNYIEKFKRDGKIRKNRNININGYLIGKEIEESGDFVYLMNYISENISVYTYGLSIENGLEFELESFDGYCNKKQLKEIDYTTDNEIINCLFENVEYFRERLDYGRS